MEITSRIYGIPQSLFLSRHLKSSCFWSLLRRFIHYQDTTEELLASYGCARWGIPRSLGSYISSPILDSRIEIVSFIVKATASGLLLVLTQGETYYVGNPVSRKWVKFRPCTLSLKSYFLSEKFGLVTRADENGAILDYKVVLVNTHFKQATTLALQIYSSQTGEWTCETIRFSCPIPWSSRCYPEPISLNGILHWVESGDEYNDDDAGGIVVIDLYNDQNHGANQGWVIPFPKKNFRFEIKGYKKVWSRRACTTSGGSIMYNNMVSGNMMNVWRMKNDYYTNDTGEYWQLSWEIDLTYVDYGVGSIPMAMHPFDTDIVYLWSLEKSCLVSINMRKLNSMLHKESDIYSDGCIVGSLENCKDYMDRTFRSFLFEHIERGLFFSPQFLPSIWMDSVPQPSFYPCVLCGR